MVYDEIELNSMKLQVVSITPSRAPKTIKQIIGKNLIQTSILGALEFQWQLSIRGILTDDDINTLSERRTMLLALEDLQIYNYTDGLHDGEYYIVPGSVSFSDSGDDQYSVARYSLELIEK